jgi:hypothetical protein
MNVGSQYCQTCRRQVSTRDVIVKGSPPLGYRVLVITVYTLFIIILSLVTFGIGGIFTLIFSIGSIISTCTTISVPRCEFCGYVFEGK